MSDPYDRLVEEGGIELLRRLNPAGRQGDHCIEAADALNDFLSTDTLAPAQTGSFVTYRMHQDVIAGFRRIRFDQALEAVRRLGHGHHIVIRATRTRRGQTETSNHYFLLANIRGNPVLLDPYGHLVIRREDRMQDYLATLIGPSYLEYASNGFDVTVHDPLRLDFPDGL